MNNLEDAVKTTNNLLILLFTETKDIVSKDRIISSLYYLSQAFPNAKLGIRIEKCKECGFIPITARGFMSSNEVSLECRCHETPVFNINEGERLLKTWCSYTNRKGKNRK